MIEYSFGSISAVFCDVKKRATLNPLVFGCIELSLHIICGIARGLHLPVAPTPKSHAGRRDEKPAATARSDKANKVAVCNKSTLHSHPITIPPISGNANLSRG